MIINNLSKILGAKRMKMTELCQLTGLSKGLIFELYHCKKSTIKFDTINKICNALECDTQELFEFTADND